MTFQELVAMMRECGVRRVDVQGLVISEPNEFGTRQTVSSVELSDTIPAPPSFEALDESEPPKSPGTCIALGCMEPGGWHFDRRYCGPHGRVAAGVKP